jgi:hypothetical protein
MPARPAAAVSNVIHRAARMSAGDERQLCSRCGCVLQEGPLVAEWPGGAPVLASFTASGSQVIVFEGITPGQFPECGPAV